MEALRADRRRRAPVRRGDRLTHAQQASIRRSRPADRATVEALLEAEDLAATFELAELLVAEDGEDVVGCARLTPLTDRVSELASLAVRPDRRGEGIGTALVHHALARADGPVQALCLQPGFFERLGFAPMDELHPRLDAKAERRCADRDVVPMVWRPSE